MIMDLNVSCHSLSSWSGMNIGKIESISIFPMYPKVHLMVGNHSTQLICVHIAGTYGPWKTWKVMVIL